MSPPIYKSRQCKICEIEFRGTCNYCSSCRYQKNKKNCPECHQKMDNYALICRNCADKAKRAKTKTCTYCYKSEPDVIFHIQTRKENGKKYLYRDSMCIQCRNEYTVLKRRATKAKCIEYKGGACHDCGLIDIQEVYDFHHIDPAEKEINIGSSSRDFEQLKIELDKCVLLCANCHRKRHAVERRLSQINPLA